MSQASATEPVTEYLGRLKRGESYAEHRLWTLYTRRMVRLANERLAGVRCGVTGAEDIASLAYHDLITGIRDDRFRRLSDRDDLWQILIMLTVRRSIDERRREHSRKRNPGRYIDVHDSVCLESVLRQAGPSPEQELQLREAFEDRLNQLEDEPQKRIAILKMKGFSNQEIAKALDCSLRSVERKLSLIRRRWMEADSRGVSGQS